MRRALAQRHGPQPAGMYPDCGDSLAQLTIALMGMGWEMRCHGRPHQHDHIGEAARSAISVCSVTPAVIARGSRPPGMSDADRSQLGVMIDPIGFPRGQ